MKTVAAKRLSGFGTSIFTEISRLALEHGAVNLGQGFPDFPAPDFIKDAAARAIRAEHNQYAPAPGLPRLRAEIATHFAQRQGVRVDADSEITIAAGATEVICDSILALVDPGDEVIVFEPAYDAYVPCVQLAGGKVVPVALRAPTFALDETALAAAFSPRTKLIVVNSPHNPTGKVFSRAELEVIARLCVQHDVIALCDEVYSEMTYDGAKHVSLITFPGMRERAVVADSIGKTFSVTGWKIGWAIAAPEITAAIRGIHQFVTFCNATPFQHAAADAFVYARENDFFADLQRTYRARREKLKGILHAAGMPTLTADGTYFLLADVRDVYARVMGDVSSASKGPLDDLAFCRRLTTTFGVAAIPTSVFYLDPTRAKNEGAAFARFCFAKSDAAMDEAARRFTKMLR